MPRKKRIALVIVPIILVLSIIAISLILVYFNTDAFKSNKILFSKYFEQNAQNIEEIYNTFLNDEYIDILKEQKHTYKTQIKINYTENIGTSSENTNNSVNNLKLNIEGQSDLKNGYNYKNIKLLNKNNEEMQIEYIQEDNIYGIKFTNLVKQFILVENSNLKELLKNIGYNEQDIDNMPDTIEFTNEDRVFSFSANEKENLQNKYLSLVGENFTEEKFLKEKNQIIKINNENINTNKYILKMTKEEFNGIYIKILEELKQDEIILKKIENLQENMNKYKMSNNSIHNLKAEYINFIDKEIKQFSETNNGQDKIEINVYECNGSTVKTEIKSNEFVISMDLLDGNKYIRN